MRDKTASTLLLLLLAHSAPAHETLDCICKDSSGFFALELGATKEMFRDDDSGNGQITALVSYIHKNDNFYAELIGGSLNGDRHTNVLFGGIGYWYTYREAYARLNFGVGYNHRLSEHLSSHNMFTESISIGYRNFFIAYRHMSNGGTMIGNPDPNKGEDAYIMGYMHPL